MITKNMIKDKKGLLPALIIPIVLGIVILIVLAAFLFSGTLRYIIIGVGILLGTFVYAIPAVLGSEVTRGKIAIVVILLAVGVLFMIVPGVMQESYSGSFVKPLWGRMECDAENVYSATSYEITKDKNNVANKIKCGTDELTEKCQYYLSSSGSQWLSTNQVWVNRWICDKNGVCGLKQRDKYTRKTTDQLIGEVVSGGYMQIEVESEVLGINTYATINKQFQRFKLFEYYGGSAKRVINSAGCGIPYSAGNNVLDGDDSSEGGSCTTGNLEKDEWCNFVSDWVYGPAYNVFVHDNYGEVYCTGAQLYEIVELETANGEIKKIDPSYSSQKEDGDRIRGLGKFLANVECCPSQPNCNDDFEWEQGDTDCFSDAQCANGGNYYYYAPKQVIREACNSEKCVLQAPITVACGRDSDCGNGQVCQKVGDIDKWKCVLGTGEDSDPDEDPDACAALSAKYPFMGYTFVETSTETCGWNPICHAGWMKPKVTTTSQCKALFLPYYIIGGIVLLVIIVVVLLLVPRKGGKKKKKQ
jgi:hypothetical protein